VELVTYSTVEAVRIASFSVQ